MLDRHVNNEKIEFVRNLIKQKKYDKAISILNKMLYENPYNSDAMFSLGQAYFSKKNYEKAKELFLEVLNINNLDTYSMFQLGKIYLYENNLDESENIFRSILLLSPDDKFSKFELGRVLVLKDRYPEAKRIFKSLLYTKSHVHAKLELGRIYLLENEIDKAEKCFNELIYNNPDDIHTKLELSKLYIKKGEIHLARKHLEEILRIKKNDNPAISELVKIYHLEKKSEKAIKLIKDYLSYKDDPFLRYELAKIYVDTNKFDLAKPILFELLEEKEYDFSLSVITELSVLYYKSGNFELAEKTLKDLLKSNPDNSKIKFRLAKIYSKLCYYDKSVKILTELLEKNEDDVSAKYELAKIYSRQNKLMTAKDIFETILNTDRKNFVKVELARIYSSLGLFNKSYHLSNDVNQTTDSNFASLGLAKSKLDQGNPDEAEEILIDFLNKNPNDEYGRLELSRVLIALDRKDEARNLLVSLLESSNKYKAISELLFLDISNEDYESAMFKLNQIYDMLENPDQIKSYLSYKLNLPYEYDDDYYSQQLRNYSYESFINKMKTGYYNIQAALINSKFMDESLIPILYDFSNNEIKNLKPSSSTLFDKYIIDYNKVIGTANNEETTKLMVITYSNDKRILLFYPISNEYNISKNKKLIIN